MNGVIWSKTQKTFVPISSVPMFAMIQQERLRQSRELEIHNFQLQNLTVTSFQESHFFEFYDNDTKVTGLCGDLWTLLSENLNFTLQAVRSNEISAGALRKNQTVYTTGLLGILTRNETIAIPKTEMHDNRLVATDFTIPLWMSSQRLYIQHEIVNDDIFIQIKTAKCPDRLVIAPTVEKMFELACMKDKEKYTIFQGEDDYKVRNQIGCEMISIGKSYFKIWVASGIVKNFKYKRTIDLGILRLKEIGLWNALTYRWLNEKHRYYDYNLEQEAIGIDQQLINKNQRSSQEEIDIC
ncbi:hypothetical protein G5I_02245 [Acromyrmex echinatior]|uniref:Uncharacterized protein n=1 Tax=Acromyrmex echinatior TaxID=103372 RepID=F4W9T7_ACREC|nr:hypothetical protein G5I_02245 [Acromyrmex echinatior]